MIFSILILIAGLVVLIVGGELMVRGAVRLAERAGLSQMLIGLTIVAFGTSTPELVASLEAARAGSPGIAWGNIVGSNIANSLLVLGLASIIFPLAVQRGPLWRDGGLALLATILLYGLSLVGGIGAIAGVAAFALLIVYLVYAYVSERRAGAGQSAAAEKRDALTASDPVLSGKVALGKAILYLIIGLAGIVLGGQWLVEGAIDLATRAGLSETVIGLTVVAIGTSLPEAVTAVIAAMKRASAVALGNVLGSNIFNILLIGGTTAIVAPGSVPLDLLAFSLPLLIAMSVVLLIFAATNHRIGRREGAVLVGAFLLQIGYSLWTG